VGLLEGYSASALIQARARSRTVGTNSSTRRSIVVVLGGDTPLGPVLILGLEKEGYIIITSVSNPDAVAEIETTGNGDGRVLVFNPKESSTLQPFLRSLKATSTLRFPLNTAGAHPSPPHPPLCRLSPHSSVPIRNCPRAARASQLTTTYEAYLKETHIMPLQAVGLDGMILTRWHKYMLHIPRENTVAIRNQCSYIIPNLKMPVNVRGAT